MVDGLQVAIANKQLTSSNISFNAIRSIAAQDLDIRHTLGFGRNIPSITEQLNQYLYSYGPMVKAQWDSVLYALCQNKWGECLNDAAKKNVPVCIADYACGQGLASVLFRESIPGLNVVHSELIEPSAVGLKRAEQLVNCCYPKATVNCTNKPFEEIQVGDVKLADEQFKIHLFSNILDVEWVDHFHILNLALQAKGHHWLVAVSHDRNHNGGTPKLEASYQALVAGAEKGWFKLHNSGISPFICGSNKPAIAFAVHLEV